MSARCRSCGARIVWARTHSGRRIPLDAVPDSKRGNVVLDGGRALVFASAEAAAREISERQAVRAMPARSERPVSQHTAHFATCPDAARHRRARTGQDKKGGAR